MYINNHEMSQNLKQLTLFKEKNQVKYFNWMYAEKNGDYAETTLGTGN